MSAIEEIILRNDRRGISALKPFLADDFCTEAAQYILDNPGSAIVCTGFYIRAAGAPRPMALQERFSSAGRWKALATP